SPQVLPCFDIDDAAIHPEVAEKVHEHAGDHITGADELPDPSGGVRVDRTGTDEVLFLEELADPTALDGPQCRVLGQLRQQHLLNAHLERAEILTARAERAA